MVTAIHATETSQSTATPASTRGKRQWNIKASPAASRSTNLIRNTVASLSTRRSSSSKPLINLGLGDPTAYGLQAPSLAAVSAVRDCLDAGNANGYVPGAGCDEAVRAVADYHRRWDGVEYSPGDITLTHGATHALDLSFNVLTFPGCNVVLPTPGFPAYKTLLGTLGCEIRYYTCRADRGWECDLEEMEREVDENTAFILVNNPSNPMGINLPPSHLRAIVSLADRLKVLIIADEIYGHMSWSSSSFVPLARLSDTVPVLTISGLSKRFLVPGWRCGWIALHDPEHVAESIRTGLHVFANRLLGPNTLIQKALPGILGGTEKEWFDEVLVKLKNNAKSCYDVMSTTPGLFCTFPTGAMYLLLGIDMTHFPSFNTDVDFASALVTEQSVFLIPGSAFGATNHVRLVIASPNEVMKEACERIKAFCADHYVA